MVLPNSTIAIGLAKDEILISGLSTASIVRAPRLAFTASVR